MFPLFGDGIFTQENVKWKRSRELLRPQFKCNKYADLEIFRKAVDNLIDAIPEQEVVDLQPLFFRLTLDLTTEFFFGVSINSVGKPESTGETNFANAFNVAQDYIARRIRWHGLHWFIGGEKFTKACKDVYCFADQIIDQHLTQGHQNKGHGKRSVFLDLLAQRTQDRTEMRSQIINILLAGRDTTASTLSWVL
jgi:cytochrome P450